MILQKDNVEEWLPLVDEEGRVVGKAQRGECHDGKSMLLHPVVHLHVFNSRGEVLLQHRPEWKTVQPDKWDTAVGGHVDFGESVEQALVREAAEEIGLRRFAPQYLFSYVHQTEVERERVSTFLVVVDDELHPSAEVDEVRFFSPKAIRQYWHTNFFTPNFEEEWEMLLHHRMLPF